MFRPCHFLQQLPLDLKITPKLPDQANRALNQWTLLAPPASLPRKAQEKAESVCVMLFLPSELPHTIPARAPDTHFFPLPNTYPFACLSNSRFPCHFFQVTFLESSCVSNNIWSRLVVTHCLLPVMSLSALRGGTRFISMPFSPLQHLV